MIHRKIWGERVMSDSRGASHHTHIGKFAGFHIGSVVYFSARRVTAVDKSTCFADDQVSRLIRTDP